MADIYSHDMRFKEPELQIREGWIDALVAGAKDLGKTMASNPAGVILGNLITYDAVANNSQGAVTAATVAKNTIMGIAAEVIPAISSVATGLLEAADPNEKRERNKVLKLDQRVKKLFYTPAMKKYIKQECNRLFAEYKKKDPAVSKQVVEQVNQAAKRLAGKKEQEVKQKVAKYREATMNIDGFDILVFGNTKDISRVAVVFFSPARKNPILRTIKIPTVSDLKAAKESAEFVSEGADTEVLFRNELAICESAIREYNEGVVTEGLTDRIKQLGETAWKSIQEMIRYIRQLLTNLWDWLHKSQNKADEVVKDAGPKAKEKTIHVDFLAFDAFSGINAYKQIFEAFRTANATIRKYSVAKTDEEKEKYRERTDKACRQIIAIMQKGASYDHDFSMADVANTLDMIGKIIKEVEKQIGVLQDLEDDMKHDAKPIGFQVSAPDTYTFDMAKQLLSLYMDFYVKLRADAEKLNALLVEAGGVQESATVIEND